MTQSIIGVAAGLLAFVAFIPYIISILKGETKPQRATFAIWSAISLVTLFSTLQFNIVLYPLYVVLSEGIVALLLIFPKLRFSDGRKGEDEVLR